MPSESSQLDCDAAASAQLAQQRPFRRDQEGHHDGRTDRQGECDTTSERHADQAGPRADESVKDIGGRRACDEVQRLGRGRPGESSRQGRIGTADHAHPRRTQAGIDKQRCRHRERVHRRQQQRDGKGPRSEQAANEPLLPLPDRPTKSDRHLDAGEAARHQHHEREQVRGTQGERLECADDAGEVGRRDDSQGCPGPPSRWMQRSAHCPLSTCRYACALTRPVHPNCVHST